MAKTPGPTVSVSAPKPVEPTPDPAAGSAAASTAGGAAVPPEVTIAPRELPSAPAEGGGNAAREVPSLRRAAEHGSAGAQYQLAIRYANGDGVPQDSEEAVRWYRRAAEQGLAPAQYQLGLRYANGDGVTKDFAAAVSWYRRAAQQGVAFAQFNLGVRYANGQGVDRDVVLAYVWFSLAAQGLLGEEADVAHRARDSIRNTLSPEQLTRGDRMVAAWKPTAEKPGGVRSRTN